MIAVGRLGPHLFPGREDSTAGVSLFPAREDTTAGVALIKPGQMFPCQRPWGTNGSLAPTERFVDVAKNGRRLFFRPRRSEARLGGGCDYIIPGRARRSAESPGPFNMENRADDLKVSVGDNRCRLKQSPAFHWLGPSDKARFAI